MGVQDRHCFSYTANIGYELPTVLLVRLSGARYSRKRRPRAGRDSTGYASAGGYYQDSSTMFGRPQGLQRELDK